jgi:hypothetical protein
VKTDASRHPRVSPKTKRLLEAVLTAIWLGGTAYLVEVLHTGLWGPIALLVVVVVAEVAFLRWSDGHWPGSEPTSA